VLSVDKPEATVSPAPEPRMTALTPRPETLIGSTYKIKWPESEHALYVTINDIEEDGRRRPFEIFINSKNMEHYAWTLALTRMVSAVFRRGGDVSFVAEELKAVFDPRGGAWLGGRYVPSLLAAIGDVIQRHLDSDSMRAPTPAAITSPAAKAAIKPRACPKCGAAALIRAEGCDKCLECGHSKCS
jgi:ribonucleoside-diphosphate reductase alpha chain